MILELPKTLRQNKKRDVPDKETLTENRKNRKKEKKRNQRKYKFRKECTDHRKSLTEYIFSCRVFSV